MIWSNSLKFVKSIFAEEKDEIPSLREGADKAIAKELELKEDAQKMAAELYLYKKCEGLTEAQRTKVFDILQGVTDVNEIDTKFTIIADSERFDPVPNGDPEADKAQKKNKKTSDPKSNEDQVEEDKDDDESGKGKAEVNEDDDDKKKVNEDSPFTQFKNAYLQVLKENKI